MRQACIYVRASTNADRQRNSHLIQISVLEEYARRNGYEITHRFSEYASGTLDEREEFLKALQHASETGSFILVYSVSRLSRSLTAFNRIAPHLQKIRFANLPDEPVSIITIGILLSLATAESHAISDRVKASHKLLKEKYGNDLVWGKAPTDDVRAIGLKVRQDNARRFNSHLASIVVDLRAAGYRTKDIPNRLNQMGIKSRRGGDITYHGLLRSLRYANQSQ